jgi:hypothetical protein
LTIPIEGQNNEYVEQSSIELFVTYFIYFFYIYTFWATNTIFFLLFRINTDDIEIGCNILSPSTSNINHNILDSKYKLLVTNTNENKQVQ